MVAWASGPHLADPAGGGGEQLVVGGLVRHQAQHLPPTHREEIIPNILHTHPGPPCLLVTGTLT